MKDCRYFYFFYFGLFQENGFKLYPPEPCPGNEVFCGGDLQKYPLEIITVILNFFNMGT